MKTAKEIANKKFKGVIRVDRLVKDAGVMEGKNVASQKYHYQLNGSTVVIEILHDLYGQKVVGKKVQTKNFNNTQDAITWVQNMVKKDTQGVAEAKNHMGETEYNTYAGWKAACRKAGADKFEGDRDICQAMKDGKGMGEWDGEKGSVYDDSHKKKKMTESKRLSESKETSIKAAHHRGKAHALAREGYNCRYDEGTEEARMYHEGYKMGLDECYGVMPMRGVVGEESHQDIVDDMASFGAMGEDYGMMEDDMFEMDKSEWMAHKAKSTPGDTFKAFGQTMHDSDVLENEFAFEGWNKQLNELLTEGDVVEEGMSVSVSKGQMGAPDSVSITASDSEADKLLSLVRQLGVFGGEEQASDYGATTNTDSVQQHGDLTVVDDHDGMMALIKKVSGGDMPGMAADSAEDYADEMDSDDHGHDHGEVCPDCGMADCQCDGHEETCNECGGMMEAGHSCGSDKEMVDEVESEDQMEFDVAEDNAPDSDEAETSADEDAEAKEDEALAMKSISEEDEEDEEEHDGLEESFANSADDTFEADMDFMTRVISGGLNKQKSTGQTTIPVIPGQKDRMGVDGMNEGTSSLGDWKKLAGLK
jgi:hypothetical protein